ncbi:putative cyanovirin-n family protein [Diaporthe ampelina]|uniref:Putative cyanovirin-n family protein n=1 Tax=Diaporthe ampelina TaxID=1214573 RepID=A0A0G2HJ20_9PEZI|nr:putative cyanovirin-n family protein [Diaporthe ampelina]
MSNFHHTCEIPSVRIDHGHILRCRVARENGEYVDAEINLNSCIGNENDFLETAEDVRFHIEGDNQPILRARLRTIEGEYEDRDLNLTERIMNRDGNLCFEN